MKNKTSSLKAIVNSLNVDIGIIVETHLKGANKLKIEGFKSFSRNRQDSAMGGIATIVDDRHSATALKVTEGESDEYIITRHGEYEPAINIINFYGKQESRQSKDQIDQSWEKIMSEIAKIESKNERLIWAGDFNRHVGNYIKDNHNKETYAGKLLKDFLDKEDYVLVNATNKVKNGPFTRYDVADPNNDSKKSTLDLVVVSKDLAEYIQEN